MSNQQKSSNKLTCFIFCFIGSILLSGCGSGVWSAREQLAQPANPEQQTTHSITVTPTSGRTVKSSSGANPSFASELPLLLSLPAAALPLNTETPPIAAPLAGSTTDSPLPPLPSSILLDSAANPPADFFLPAGIFGKPTQDLKQTVVSPSASAATSKPVAVTPKIQVTPVTMPDVILYASRTTRAYFSAGGVDASVNIQAWEDILRKYGIPFETVNSVEILEKKSSGVLVLPSTVALSERERQAVIGFRAKGGGVLASWLTGVRNEYGEWRGFGFMETALDTKVVGNTEADEDDTFLIPYGDSPVTHQVPAGLRNWMERDKE